MEQWVESLGLTMADVKAQDRRPAMVQVRREIAFYMRAHHWSLPAIGEFLDRDHTTILSLVGTRSSNLLKLEAARRAHG